MLASALDCHPSLHFCGEYPGDPEVDGKHNFYIVHANEQYNQCRAAGRIPERIIVLHRDVSGRILSKRKGERLAQLGIGSLHYDRPLDEDIGTLVLHEQDKGYDGMRRVTNRLEELMELYSEALVLRYEELTGDHDIREIPEPFATRIFEFLEIEPCRLTPRMYKPELTYKEAS